MAPFLQEQRLSRYKPITISRSQISETKITGERRGGIERAREINTERVREKMVRKSEKQKEIIETERKNEGKMIRERK